MPISDDFLAVLKLAQSGDVQATERILTEFTPLIKKYRYIGQNPDDDLYGELQLAAYLCVTRFRVDEEDLRGFIAEAQRLFPP